MEPSSIVIGGPEVVYRAPVGTAFPGLTDSEATILAAGWIKLGVNGNKSYSEDGVTVRHPQSINRIRPAGSTGPIKAARTEEDFEVEWILWDMTFEAYSGALSQQTVTDSGGERVMGIYRGFSIPESAWLLRGTSPYDDTLVAQYELPRGYTEGAPEIAFVKGQPAGLQFLVVALVDPDAAEGEEFGVVRAEDPDSGT
jgi:hypothetical protein